MLNDVQCLSLVARTGASADSEAGIRRLALAFPQVIVDDKLSMITDERKMYLLYETDPEDDMEKLNVDDYWFKVLETRNAVDNLKFSTLGKVVKACLALSHGNSDAERSFSANKRIVAQEHASLNEKTINAI